MSEFMDEFYELLQKEASEDQPEVIEEQGELDFLAALEKEAGSEPEDIPDGTDTSTITTDPTLEKVASDLVNEAIKALESEFESEDLVKLASEDPESFKQVLAAALIADQIEEDPLAADTSDVGNDDIPEVAQAYLAWKQRTY